MPQPEQIRVTVDHAPQVAPAGTTAAAVFAAAAVKDAVAVRVNAAPQSVDLAHVAADGEDLEPISVASDEGRAVLRHSCAHVLAQAVQDLFPGTALGIGPPIKDGFYYDFAPERPFVPEDLTALEKRMNDIIRQRQHFARRVVSEQEARIELARERFKLELLDLEGGPGSGSVEGASTEIGGPEITMYDNLVAGQRVWSDLCRGPHLPTTRDIPAFKLMRSAAAYWRGDEKNVQLQRIYGTAWENRDALKAHLALLAEAERRDHRRLGADLDLFSFPDEIGSGLAVFHPKGGVIRRVMEDYSRRQHERAGYSFVNSPHIAKAALFETSGHLQWYADGMYPPMQMEGADYYLKPMNCPFHNLIFRSRGRSYRELPLRLFEFGSVYRNEKSGVIHGLTRVRGMTQDDSHIYCTRQQMPAELSSLLAFVLDLLRDFGLTDFYLELSTRDETNEKFVGAAQDWAEATAALEQAAASSALELVPDPGGAAFYGPKISVQARDAIGRTWQMSTIQVDLQTPTLFDLEYAADDGTRQRPVMIHRALFGSIERFFAVLLEHYAGAFPAWLAPVQVSCIPIADAHAPYLEDVAARLRAEGIRVEVDVADDRMQKKIRTAQQQKVPYMLLAGDTDIAAGAVSFRLRDGTQDNAVPVQQAIDRIVSAVRTRA